VTYGPAAVCGFQSTFAREVSGLLKSGENTLRVLIHNVPIETLPGGINPAGMTARLTMKGI
jgi:hypothetical protein